MRGRPRRGRYGRIPKPVYISNRTEIKKLEPPSRGRMIELAKIALQEGAKNVYIKTRQHGLERVE